MTGNFLLSTIEQRFHYPTLLVTQCVKVALNFSQIADSLLGLTLEPVPNLDKRKKQSLSYHSVIASIAT
jgi:hypothetical protein